MELDKEKKLKSNEMDPKEKQINMNGLIAY
jgi:hypothetical protein